jgi:hypothetical protein
MPRRRRRPRPVVQGLPARLYLLDPFYIACREQSRTGLYRLSEVAPEHFELTEYYQRYFRVNVVADEIQLNCQLEGDRTLCLLQETPIQQAGDQVPVGAVFDFSAGTKCLITLALQDTCGEGACSRWTAKRSPDQHRVQ